jgi:hypothetical protein
VCRFFKSTRLALLTSFKTSAVTQRITHSASHTAHHTQRITHSASHTAHHTQRITHSASHTAHHTQRMYRGASHHLKLRLRSVMRHMRTATRTCRGLRCSHARLHRWNPVDVLSSRLHRPSGHHWLNVMLGYKRHQQVVDHCGLGGGIELHNAVRLQLSQCHLDHADGTIDDHLTR